MAITIKQIAQQAGVSRGTVDRVLHNRPGVKPEVAEQVRRIADELGFLPNRAGKILAARKQPLTVGCFFPGIGNPFYIDMKAGIQAAAAEFAHYGVSVLLEEVAGYEVETHVAAIRRLAERCGALCVSTIDVPEIQSELNRIIAQGIPVVAVNTDLTGTDRLCYVGCDYLEGGRTAAGLLAMVAREQLNLLIVTGSLKVKGHNDRVRGFSSALRQKGCHYRLVEIFESLDNDDHAYRTTLATLSAHPEINCIYVVAGGIQGVCRAVVELGRQGQLQVLCYDDTAPVRRLMEAGVINFTICQEAWQQGYKAVQLIFDYFVEGKAQPPADMITGTVIKILENLD